MAVILYCVATYYHKQDDCNHSKGQPDACVENTDPVSKADAALLKNMEIVQACVPGFSLLQDSGGLVYMVHNVHVSVCLCLG